MPTDDEVKAMIRHLTTTIPDDIDHNKAAAMLTAQAAALAAAQAEVARVMGEIVGLVVARDRQDEVIDAYNDLLRSASQIAKREGIEKRIASTNWDSFYNRLTVCLHKYHADWLASAERRKTL